jgi:hypothetical protein
MQKMKALVNTKLEMKELKTWIEISPKVGRGEIYPDSRGPRALAVDECTSVWPACPGGRRGMSFHWGVRWGALRAEAHFGVQARALPVGLH